MAKKYNLHSTTWGDRCWILPHYKEVADAKANRPPTVSLLINLNDKIDWPTHQAPKYMTTKYNYKLQIQAIKVWIIFGSSGHCTTEKSEI